VGDIKGSLDLAEVIEAEQSRLMRFLVARTRDLDLAEDLLQDARAKLLMGVGDQHVSNPVPYLYQMLANMVEDHRRSERSRAQRARDWGDRGEGFEPGRADHVTPEQNASDRDMLAKMLEGLEHLPGRTREIFLAYRVGGVSQKQIAADHDISLSAVEKHLQRAYRKVIDIRKKLNAGFE